MFELFTLMEAMPDRVDRLLALHTIKNDEERTSLACIFKPTNQGNFHPIYICLEGIPKPNDQRNKRYEMFKALSEQFDKPIVEFTVPPSETYHEEEQYFQQIIAVLRLNHLLPPI
ncbi:hypothetical protein TMU01_02290 [Tenuibacillus multivorans]|nr:hypothetical protein TMU01_02290 [Tenuibacillus multivorans]